MVLKKKAKESLEVSEIVGPKTERERRSRRKNPGVSQSVEEMCGKKRLEKKREDRKRGYWSMVVGVGQRMLGKVVEGWRIGWIVG